MRPAILTAAALAVSLGFAVTAARAEQKTKPAPAAKAVAKKAEKPIIVVPNSDIFGHRPLHDGGWVDVVHSSPSVPLAPLQKPAAPVGASVEKDPF
jgi:nitrogen fixation protein